MNTHNDCHFCTTNGRHINGNHWTGTEYIRVYFCEDCRPNIAKAPRTPRAPRRPRQTAYGDYATIAALAGRFNG